MAQINACAGTTLIQGEPQGQSVDTSTRSCSWNLTHLRGSTLGGRLFSRVRTSYSEKPALVDGRAAPQRRRAGVGLGGGRVGSAVAAVTLIDHVAAGGDAVRVEYELDV